MHPAKCTECSWAGFRLESVRSEADFLLRLAGTIMLRPCPKCGAGLSPARYSREVAEAMRQHIGRGIGFPVDARYDGDARMYVIAVKRPARRKQRGVPDGDVYRVHTEEDREEVIVERMSEMAGDRDPRAMLDIVNHFVDRFRADVEERGWVP